MTDKEIRIAVTAIIEEAKLFPVGTIKYYPDYKFSIEKKKVFYLHDITGIHPSGSATGMSQRIRKAIIEHAGGK